MTPKEKRLKTIIDKFGSWEAYKQWRYYNPEKAEQRKAQASKAGSSPKRFYPYQDKELASRAGKAKRGKNTKV